MVGKELPGTGKEVMPESLVSFFTHQPISVQLKPRHCFRQLPHELFPLPWRDQYESRAPLAVLVTTVAFFRCSKTAGRLLLPYLAWVSFASVLNFTIWRMNLA